MDTLIGPESLTFRDGSPVTSTNHYIAWLSEQLLLRQAASGRSFAIHNSDSSIDARVIHGRYWIVECPCGNNTLTSPAIPIACCLECGVVHTAVVFPAEQQNKDHCCA